jgi:uncharacterized protein YqjF (DUF2071 family)
MPTAESRPFLTARWVHLAMLSYEVGPTVLSALVPKGTELDFWSGKCLVSMVGFQFLDTRVLGLSVPFHRDFEEVNLRFYVKRTIDGETRRGVVFVKEIVPRRAVAWIANTLYNEKYVTLPMSHDDRMAEASRMLSYSWQFNGQQCRLGVAPAGESFLPDGPSEEAFITEHYFGYTAQRDGSTLEYRVEHPRWNVWKATNPELSCDVAALYGPELSTYLSATPSSCFVADGSEIMVRRGQRI